MLLVDVSYYIFYRFYATLHWYCLRNKDVDPVNQNIVDDVAFMHAYYSHVDKDIQKWKQKHKGQRIILCKDCKREDIWRMQFYPNYKGTREHAPTFRGEIFPLTYRHLEKNGMCMLSHSRLEADDIAFICHKVFREKGYKDVITVITNDNDYLQIEDPSVNLVNMQGRDIRTRGCGNPKDDKKKKVLMGDKSDNIPAVMKGLGPKTVEKLLLLTDDQLHEWIVQKGGVAAVENYQKNCQLIDFNNIPVEYQEDMCKELENLKLI